MEDYVRTPVEEESLREATRRFRSGRGSDLSAEELARTLRIRCYGRGGSGNLVPRPLARRDVAAMAITCGACVVCAVVW